MIKRISLGVLVSCEFLTLSLSKSLLVIILKNAKVSLFVTSSRINGCSDLNET